MISEAELQRLCQHLGCPPATLALIQAIQAAPPSRRVRSAVGNVSVRYPSRKMGVTIQAESHRNELAAIYSFEHDPDTLAYYDQPPPIKLAYLSRRGRRVAAFHTPDFFVIRTDSIGWEECKLEADLLRLQETMPHRYVRTTDGGWSCPPGESYAAPFGLTYRVRSSATVNWTFQRNIQFLADYLSPDCPPIAPDVTAFVQAMVRQQPGVLLHDLLALLPQLSSDVLFTLIAQHQLVVDLFTNPLAEPERVPVFPVSDQVTISQLPTLNVAPTGRALSVPTPSSQEVRDLLAVAGPTALAEAHRRYAIIVPLFQDEQAPSQLVPGRTVRRWLAAYRQADTRYGMGFVGLLPHIDRRGNRTPKLPPATQQLIDEMLMTEYEIPTRPRPSAVYARLAHTAAERSVPVPSYKTFARMVKRRPQYEQQLQREGARAAYSLEPWYWELEFTTPRHGDRPWELVHLDHTELDIELVCSRTGRGLGRPWLSLLMDGFSRRILTLALSFEPPSYRSCMRVLRQCVQQHGRLPQILIVDGGAEFASLYLETLLAQYAVTKKTRPAAKPRFGSLIERLFGTTHTSFIYNLAGNTQLTRQVRQLTPAVDPKRHACWTLDRLGVALERWASAVYDHADHPALGQSPLAAWEMGLAQGGLRPHRQIAYDDTFVMATLPTTMKGTAKVHPNLGVKIHNISYWADVFRDPAIEGTQVPVRYDPDDAGLAYAYVAGRWVRCISEQYARLAGRSEREIALASAELRRRHQQHASRYGVTAQALGAFLVSLDAEELLLEQRLRDHALRTLTQGTEPHAPVVDQVAPISPDMSARYERLDPQDLTPYEDY